VLFYINIPFKLIVSDALRIAIKHECIFKNYFIVLFGCPIEFNLILRFLLIKSRFLCRPIHARASKFQSFLGPAFE